jgi:hypothetical protein
MHNATKRNIIAQRRRLTWAGSLNPGNSKSPRNRPRFNGRGRISVVIRGIRIPLTAALDAQYALNAGHCEFGGFAGRVISDTGARIAALTSPACSSLSVVALV